MYMHMHVHVQYIGLYCSSMKFQVWSYSIHVQYVHVFSIVYMHTCQHGVVWRMCACAHVHVHVCMHCWVPYRMKHFLVEAAACTCTCTCTCTVHVQYMYKYSFVRMCICVFVFGHLSGVFFFLSPFASVLYTLFHVHVHVHVHVYVHVPLHCNCIGICTWSLIGFLFQLCHFATAANDGPEVC